jgi:hypothetical protein
MANNFLPWNPNAANQESDAAYAADSQRTGGAASGSIFTSLLANKFFYQIGIWIAAMAAMLTDKGFVPNDGSSSPGTALTSLKAVLANILTKADPIPQIAVFFAAFNNFGAIPLQSIYTVPTFAVFPTALYARGYRFNWHARVVQAAGGSGNIIGPLTLTYVRPDGSSATITITGAAFTEAGGIATTHGGNAITSVLSGMPITILAKPGTNISVGFGYHWSGVSPSLAMEFYSILEYLNTN